MLIRHINSMLDTFNRYDLRGEDLTVPQFAILNHATVEGVPLSEISARMLCDNSNLTGIVDRLIAKGLVERRPDPQDRRVSLICLTPAGAEKLKSIGPRHHENVNRRIHALPKEKVKQLRDLLLMLHESMSSELGLDFEGLYNHDHEPQLSRADTVRTRVEQPDRPTVPAPKPAPMPRHGLRTRSRAGGKQGSSHS